MLTEATVDPKFEGTELIDFGTTETLPNSSPVHAIQATLRKVYNSGSEPEGIDIWSGVVALSGGSKVLDLAALPYPSERDDADFTGERVVAFIFYAPSSNTGPIKIEGGDSNPYELFGDADTERELDENTYCVWAQVAGATGHLAAVAAGAKDVKFTGTGSEVLHAVIIVGGTP